MRQCLSYARAHNIERVQSKDVSRILKEYFDWNLNYVYDVWEDTLSGTKTPLSLRVEYRDIFRVVRANYETGQPGVSLETIKAEVKTKPLETETKVYAMRKAGLLYEPAPGYFRLIPRR
jgi:hypothetical protein